MLLRRSLAPVASQRRFVTTIEGGKKNPININTRRSIPPDRWNFATDEPAFFSGRFRKIPAIGKWFKPYKVNFAEKEKHLYHKLMPEALEPYGSTTVPLELTTFLPSSSEHHRPTSSFERFEAPFSTLLTYLKGENILKDSLYLAQCPLEDLPAEMRADVPQPDMIEMVGRGDIYGSSLWMGRTPTRTPLHRDPNPNLFVQLAGRKVIRLLQPKHGKKVYDEVRAGSGSANMRGEEMMVGEENDRLERAVWEDRRDHSTVKVWEATMESGDGLFIPLGWWHAVRGVGEGVNASVNWWFR